MDINEFGQHSFVTWTTGLKERIEMSSMEPEFICGSCGHTFDSEPPFHIRPKKCPHCGDTQEIKTIEEHNAVMFYPSRTNNGL